MKKILNTLILLCVSSSPLLVCAAQWQSLGKREGAEYFFDRESISGSNAERSITIKKNFLEGAQAPTSLELKYKINCISEEFTLVSGKIYKETDLRGGVAPGSFAGINTPAKPQANTMSVVFIKTACSSQNQSNRQQTVAAEQISKTTQLEDRKIFGLVDDLNTRLIDQSSAARRLSSCIGVMKGAQYAANAISQFKLSDVLAQQEDAFHSFGAGRFPPVDTLERMMLDGAMREAQARADALSTNNQQALVFKIANNCKATLGAALKN